MVKTARRNRRHRRHLRRPRVSLITPASNEFTALGQTVQLSASVFDGNNRRIADTTVSWSSSNTEVVTVTAQGVIMSVSNGVARITATAGNITATADVVVAQVAANVTIIPPSGSLTAMGQTLELTAVVYDLNNQIVNEAGVSWSSDSPDIVTVDSQGVITAVKNGIAEITATTKNSRSATIRVSVSDPGLDREILVAFYNALDGPGWMNDSNWRARLR